MTSIFSRPIASNAGDHSSSMNARALLEENKALKEQVIEGRQKIQSLAKRLTTASADVAKSVQSVASYDIIDNKLHNCIAERDAAVRVVEASRKEIAESNKVVTSLEKEAKEQSEGRRSDAEAAEEKLDALKNMLQSVSTQVTEVKATKEATESKLKMSQGRVEKLEQGARQQTQREKALEASLKSLATERFELTKKVSSMGTMIAQKETKCVDLDTKVASLAYAKQTLQRDVSTAREENKKLTDSRDSLIVTGAGKSKTIEAQHGRIQKLDLDKAQGHVEVTTLKHHIDMMAQAHAAALVEIDEYKQVMVQTQRNMKDREMTAQQTQSLLESQLAVLNQQKDNLKGDVDLTISYLQATRQEVLNLRTTVQERDQSIVEEKEKLASLAGSETTAVLNEDGKITISVTDGHF